MDQSIIKEVKHRKEEKEVLETSNWSELHPDLLQCVFDQLSFMSLNQAKSVCSSWYSASKLCVPNQNQIPWLFIKEYKSSNCVVFVPEEEKVYRIRDLGDDFAQSDCVKTCGSWLLLRRRRSRKTVGYLYYYILNLLTGERIDLPDYLKVGVGFDHEHCFWINNRSKDYLVVVAGEFTKKGYNNWQNLQFLLPGYEQIFYKNQKIHVYNERGGIWIWDVSREKPRMERCMSFPYFNIEHNDEQCLGFLPTRMVVTRMAVTVSGDFLKVSYMAQRGKPLYFCINKINKVYNKWVRIDSLGDEALIYDMGITVNVITNGGNIPGIKRNSIYFNNEYDVFVYDLATQKKEPLPECVLSSMFFGTGPRWFFPLFAF